MQKSQFGRICAVNKDRKVKCLKNKNVVLGMRGNVKAKNGKHRNLRQPRFIIVETTEVQGSHWVLSYIRIKCTIKHYKEFLRALTA